MYLDRAKIGVPELDHVLKGGLPRKSLTLVCGGPGTGKTFLSARFIHAGACEGERGVYVTFGEEKSSLIQNLAMTSQQFQEMEQKGLIRIMDLLTVREEGLSIAFETIFAEVVETNANRLVIDSFSVVSQSCREEIDARIMLHSILRKIMKEMKCTTLITSEGEEARQSMEGYVSDGIIVLRKGEMDGRQLRELEILKMRGTRIDQHKFLFSLENGFRMIKTFGGMQTGRWRSKSEVDSQVTADSAFYEQLLSDKRIIFEVGYEVESLVRLLIAIPVLKRAIEQGRKSAIVLLSGLDLSKVTTLLGAAVGKQHLRSDVKIVVPSCRSRISDEWIYRLDKSMFDLKPLLREWKTSGKKYALLSDFGFMSTPGMDEGTLDKVLMDPEVDLPEIDLRFTSPKGLRTLLPTCDGSLYRIRESHGSAVLYGVKPPTILYGIECNPEQPAQTELIPII